MLNLQRNCCSPQDGLWQTEAEQRKTGVIFLHGNLLPGESRFSEWQMRNRLCGIFAAAS